MGLVAPSRGGDPEEADVRSWRSGGGEEGAQRLKAAQDRHLCLR